MDPALLREREAFKKRALAMPTVEKRKTRPEEPPPPKFSKKSKPPQKAKSITELNYKALSGSSNTKFAILTKIVKHMKVRHQQEDTFPLSLEDILDETKQMDASVKIKHWLETEALLNNPKIEVVDGNMFKYKPVYNIKDRKGLLRLLDKNDQRGLGGVFYEDVEESLPNVKKALRQLGDQVVYYTRPHDKKEVLFYNDKSYQFSVDEDIQKLWRSVAVEGIDEKKIEEYLAKQGIASMQDTVQRVAPGQKRRKVANRKRNKNFKKHNEHMGDVLQDYSEDRK